MSLNIQCVLAHLLCILIMYCPVLDSPKVKLHNKVNGADSKELDRHNRQTKVNFEVTELYIIILGESEENETEIMLFYFMLL